MWNAEHKLVFLEKFKNINTVKLIRIAEIYENVHT